MFLLATSFSLPVAIMKKIRCPKCDEKIVFDETLYAPGRVLVFECNECHKQFRIRIPEPVADNDADEATKTALGWIVVVENAFHLKQYLPLYAGDNKIGRWVKGTAINAPIKTVDPSVDTLHCVINVATKTGGETKFVLRDGPSCTGTFCMNELVGNKERVNISEGAIITIGATTLLFTLEPPEDYEV